MTNFDLDNREREKLTDTVLKLIHSYLDNSRNLRVTTELNEVEIRQLIRESVSNSYSSSENVLITLFDLMIKGNLHAPHPKYMGLFTPRIPFVIALSELIKAVLNPNLGSWGHAPFPVEVEAFLVEEIGLKFGYKRNKIDGTFTTGGAEGNLTAILCALYHSFTDCLSEGITGLKKKPVLYCSVESHHSIIKAARITGIGSDSVCMISTLKDNSMDPDMLEIQIKKDLNSDRLPFMIISTCGTTGCGAIDLMKENSRIAKEYNLWHHVDAAYGGALIFSNELKPHIDGIELSDSICFDLHKWPASTVGSNIFLTSHTEILHYCFETVANYMPEEVNTRVDPYAHSVQWSRRFAGLGLFTMLMTYGWEGYTDLIQRQLENGNYLQGALNKNGWIILSESILPIICFTHHTIRSKPNVTQEISNKLVSSGKAWVSTYELKGVKCLRACITNFATTQIDIDEFIDEIDRLKSETLGENNYG